MPPILSLLLLCITASFVSWPQWFCESLTHWLANAPLIRAAMSSSDQSSSLGMVEIGVESEGACEERLIWVPWSNVGLFLSHWVRIGSCILSNENWLYKQCGNSQSTHAVPHNQSLKVSSIYMSLHMCHDFTLLKIWSLLLRTTRVNSWFHPWIWPHIRRPYTLEEQFWLGKMAWQLVSDFQTVEVKQITGP